MFLLAIAPDLLCAISAPYQAEQAEFIPPEVLRLPVIGQLYGSRDMNPEAVAALAPDLVIDVGAPRDGIAGDMDNFSRTLGVPVIHIAAALESTPEAFRSLGRLLGREPKGEALARFCERALAKSEEAQRRYGTRLPVLYCLGPGGTHVLARGSFHAEVLDRLADNLAAIDAPSSRGTGNETDLEQILLWDPEVILFAPDSIYAEAGSNRLWRELGAIKNRNYFRVPSEPFNWMGSPPSINRYLGMLWLGTLLYHADYSLYEEAAEYYRLFYGYELSRERFNALTQGSLR
jgi:iron complex transport system substrate-binding protein